jgi:hypothetical protein
VVKWIPTADSVVEISCTDGRVVIGVHADAVPAMLAWLAAPLLRDYAHVLARRHSDNRCGPRGASIILTGAAESSSGPHKDCEPTLLLAVSGMRHVWYAAPSNVAERVQLRTCQSHLGAPTLLPKEYDPTCNPACDCVQWCGPVTLEAGSAMWIPAGWWHCVLAAPHAIAIPCEVVSEVFSMQKCPCVLTDMAPTKPHGRSGKRVSRREGWASGEKVASVFVAVLASKPEHYGGVFEGLS